MSLQEPRNKMSKSDAQDGGCVYIMDKPEDVMRAFKRAVTDSDTSIRYNVEEKPGISNLMQIYSVCADKTLDEVENEFSGLGYGVFKQRVGESVVERLRPVREEALRIMSDKAYLEEIYKQGAQKASYVAEKTLRKVYKKLGFVQK